ncbi:hypothetical protein [Amycolatopsis sp. NPDC003861]
MGRAILAANPGHPGSLGIANAEALEVACKNPELGYNRGPATRRLRRRGGRNHGGAAEGQGHVADPKVLGSVLKQFFAA